MKVENVRTVALVQQLWEETHVLQFVGSNPSTVYWMDIFSHLFVVKIALFVWKDEKEAEGGPFLKKIENVFELIRKIGP